MKTKILCGLLSVWAVSVVGAERPLHVVATISDLAAIAAAVGGEAVEVRSIAQGHEDPHFLNARPSYIIAARDADLWIRAGMELEVGWEPVLLSNARNPNVLPGARGFLDVSAHIPVKLDVSEGPVTRAQGDVHPSGNPHYLLDPLNARAAARAIARKLAELRPALAEQFRRHAEQFVREVDLRMFGEAALEKADGETLWKLLDERRLEEWARDHAVELTGWYASTRSRSGCAVVVYHKSFDYFAHRFGFDVRLGLEPIPGVPPTPAHLKRLVDDMKQRDIKLVLMEPFYPRKPADFVATRTGARVAVVSAYAPDTKADAWLRMMDAIVQAVSVD